MIEIIILNSLVYKYLYILKLYEVKLCLIKIVCRVNIYIFLFLSNNFFC